MKSRLSRSAWSWALYDWANSAFVLTILTVFYGPLFLNYWYNGPAESGLFWQGVSVSLSSFLVALAAPILGSISSKGAVKKTYLAVFMGLGVTSTLILAMIPPGYWQLAIIVRIIASLGFFGSLVFYDALIVDVSTPQNRHFLSGLGFSMGYLGSVILFAAQFYVVSHPDDFGFENPVSAIKASFVAVAIWWTLFTIPLLINVKESAVEPTPSLRKSISECFVTLKGNLSLIFNCKPALVFLIAYFFYIDGVNTLMQMSSSFASGVGIPQNQIMGTLLVVQIVGVPCALFLGWLGQHVSPKRILFVCIVVYLGVTLYASKLSPESISLYGWNLPEIYLLGILIGTVQGGLQALSRSYYTQFIPPHQEAAFFGFYNMLGKGGAIMGSILMGLTSWITGDPKWGALSVAILFLIGIGLLSLTPNPQTIKPEPGQAVQ